VQLDSQLPGFGWVDGSCPRATPQECDPQTVSEQSTPFMAVLQAMSYESRSAFLRDLLVLTATNLGYCARSRTLLKRMANTLAVEWDEVAAVEVALGAYMKAELDCLTADVKGGAPRRGEASPKHRVSHTPSALFTALLTPTRSSPHHHRSASGERRRGVADATVGGSGEGGSGATGRLGHPREARTPQIRSAVRQSWWHQRTARQG
jgi:hypothetical protein